MSMTAQARLDPEAHEAVARRLVHVAVRQLNVVKGPAQHVAIADGERVGMRGCTNFEGSQVEFRRYRICDHDVEGSVGTGVLEADGVVDPLVLIDVVQLVARAAAGVRRLVVGVVAARNGGGEGSAVVRQHRIGIARGEGCVEKKIRAEQ